MSLFRDDLISEYDQWKKHNGSDFTWWDYLNIKFDLQTALSFSKFFYPEIIEMDGCFFLKDKFDAEQLESWKSSCDEDKTCVERMMNFYQIKDFFDQNQNEEENEEEQVVVLGSVLKLFWNMSIQHQLSDPTIVAELFEDRGDLFITVYKKR